MKIKLGNSDISDIRLGSNQISAVYAGDTKMFPETVTTPEPVSMTANAEQTVSMDNGGAPEFALEYSYDKNNWSDWDSSALTFGTGSNLTVYFRANNEMDFWDQFVFGTSAPISLSGNIMSLINYTASTLTIPSDHMFMSLFSNATALTSVSSDFLPATGLTKNCYYAMFNGCTSLSAAPALPATTLADSCYSWMFNGCTGLTTAPALPATTLASSCYNQMFQNCRSLSAAPALPSTTLTKNCYFGMFAGCSGLTTTPVLQATTLANNCYAYMFSGCTSLSAAPALPATTLANNCYAYMFSGCTSLNEIHCDATDISATNCTNNWVNGVASSGDFYGKSAAGWTTGNSGIPSNWTQHLT